MTDKEIYKLWLANVDDHRYLRPRRWQTVRKVIEYFKLRSVLEFGAGISTMLFQNLGMRLVSYETDAEYLESISHLLNGVETHLWDNENLEISEKFDLSLVDGALSRRKQLEIALNSARFVALDDYIGSTERRYRATMAPYERIDNGSTWMAVFKID